MICTKSLSDSLNSLFGAAAVDFCRHLVSLRKKTLRNVCHCDSAEIRFVVKSLKSVIIWTFS